MMYLIAELSVSFGVGFMLGAGILYGIATLFDRLFGDNTETEDS